MEVGCGSQAAVPPSRVEGGVAHGGAGFSFGNHALVHVSADEVGRDFDHWIHVVVEWISERRAKHDGASGRGLVMVVDDLGVPLRVQNAVDVARFGHVVGVEVAVVVVATILLVEVWKSGHAAGFWVGSAHVPVGNPIVSVGVGVDEEDDAVLEHPFGLGIVLTREAVRHLDEVLSFEHFAGVEPAVNPDDRLLVLDKLFDFIVVLKTFCQGEALVALSDAFEISAVAGVGDDAHQLVASILGLSDVFDGEAVRFCCEQLPVIGQFCVIGQVIVFARVVTEELLWRWHVRGRGQRRESENNKKCEPAHWVTLPFREGLKKGKLRLGLLGKGKGPRAEKRGTKKKRDNFVRDQSRGARGEGQEPDLVVINFRVVLSSL